MFQPQCVTILHQNNTDDSDIWYILYNLLSYVLYTMISKRIGIQSWNKARKTISHDMRRRFCVVVVKFSFLVIICPYYAGLLYRQWGDRIIAPMPVNDMSKTCGDRVISVYLGQYHGCWCPGSLLRQDIGSHDIEYLEYVDRSLTWGRVLVPVSNQCGGMT